MAYLKPSSNRHVNPSRRESLRILAASLLASSAWRTAAADRSQPLLRLAPSSSHSHGKLTPLKRRAMRDYQQSTAGLGGGLSNAIEQLETMAACGGCFDVLVVGSGYGGAICAARLSQRLRPGARIAILERGREWIPGTFPDTFSRLLRESRYGLWGPGREKLRNPLGLIDFTFNDEVHVMSGNGLGGGSLINAGVAVIPDEEVFRQACWPAALHELDGIMPFYERVAEALDLQPIGCDTPKTLALRRLAERVGGRASVTPAFVAVNQRRAGMSADGLNRFGMMQRPCELCGDCTSGCNIGAKNTLPFNYLPLARQNGAEIYTQTDVQHIEPADGHYRVVCQHHDPTAGKGRSRTLVVKARIVILAAGSLGSTGILLRSQRKHFAFSPRLGDSFSGNGDVYGFVVGADCETHVGGTGAHPSQGPVIGVSQQLHLKLHDPCFERRMLLQEGTAPRALSNALGALLIDMDLDHSLPLLALGHDGAGGRIELRDGRPHVVWPERLTSDYSQFAHGNLRQLASALNGRYRRPEMLGEASVTVHPLGGCSMSDAVATGVTNDRGQVFAATAPQRHRYFANAEQACDNPVHAGLYVADGALIPTSLGVNPFFTIAALSERIAAAIGQEPQWADLFVA